MIAEFEETLELEEAVPSILEKSASTYLLPPPYVAFIKYRTRVKLGLEVAGASVGPNVF